MSTYCNEQDQQARNSLESTQKPDSDQTVKEFASGQFPGQFPRTRLRRNRRTNWARALQRETSLGVENLIWPVFVREASIAKECVHMPSVSRLTKDELLQEIRTMSSLGLSALMLFPVVETQKRDESASEALNENGLLCDIVRALKSEFPSLTVITDVALDPYTSHGQDGLIADGCILNDETLEILKDHALVQAKAGADVIAPSEMMDGRIGVLRDHLDKHGYQNVSLMSYAAKYASSYYGPFREALQSDNCLGTADKKTYQMDPANANEALREVALDLQEGADSVIVKPGLAYLDIVCRVKDTFKAPTIAYHVSGEYAMLKAAAKSGYIDYNAIMMETLLCFRRAGCDAIITYCAPDAARLLYEQNKHSNPQHSSTNDTTSYTHLSKTGS